MKIIKRSIWIIVCTFLVVLTGCKGGSGQIAEDARYYVSPRETTEAIVSTSESVNVTEPVAFETTKQDIYEVVITLQADPDETVPESQPDNTETTEDTTDFEAYSTEVEDTAEVPQTEEVPAQTVVSEDPKQPAQTLAPERPTTAPAETIAPVLPTAAPEVPTAAPIVAPTTAETLEVPTDAPTQNAAPKTTADISETLSESAAQVETTETETLPAEEETTVGEPDTTPETTQPDTDESSSAEAATEQETVESSTEGSADIDPTEPETTSEAEIGTSAETVPETTQEETTETPTQAQVVPKELRASIRKEHYVGESLSARDFKIEVVMSDDSVLTDPPGWAATPLELNDINNEITVTYGSLSIVLSVTAQERQVSALPAGINHAVVQSAVSRLGSGYKMGAKKTTDANYRLFDCATLVWACLEENGIHNMPGGTGLWVGNIRNKTLSLNYNNRPLSYVYCATPEIFAAAANDPANLGKCIVLTTPCDHNTLGAFGVLREGAIEVYNGHIALIVGNIAPPKKINGSGTINNNYSVAKYARQAFDHLSKYYVIPNPEGMVHVLGQLSTETYQANVNGNAGSSGAYTLANKSNFRQVGGASDPGHNIWSYNLFTANAQQPWSVLHNFTQFSNTPYGDGTVWKIEALTERWGVTYTNNCGGFVPGDVNAYVVYLKDQ